MHPRSYEPTPARKVAFLGLGVMGYPMAGHLKRAGHEVTVYTRTQAKADGLLALGAQWASSPAEPARGAVPALPLVAYPHAVYPTPRDAPRCRSCPQPRCRAPAPHTAIPRTPLVHQPGRPGRNVPGARTPEADDDLVGLEDRRREERDAGGVHRDRGEARLAGLRLAHARPSGCSTRTSGRLRKQPS